MFWEYSPSSTNLVSDWLKAESYPLDEEEIKIKMDDGDDMYFTRLEGFKKKNVDLLEARPSFWDAE